MGSRLAQSREDGGAHYDHHLRRTDPLTGRAPVATAEGRPAAGNAPPPSVDAPSAQAGGGLSECSRSRPQLSASWANS